MSKKVTISQRISESQSHNDDDFDELNEGLTRRSYISNQYKLASVSYGLLFCLIGVVLTTIEPFKACTKCENLVKILIESFFIYMYVVSIVWLSVMFVLITIAKRNEKIAIKHPHGTNRRLSIAPKKLKGLRNEKQALLSKLISRRESNTVPSNNESSSVEESNVSIMISTSDLSSYYFTYDYENGTGELYMRVGTAIFSICAMIDRCLSLIQMLEAYFNHYNVISECKITFIVSIIAKSTSLLFIFIQSFFIFKYANIVINYGKNSALIGLMHIIAANFCVFLRSIVHETVDEIRHHHSTVHKKSSPEHNLIAHHGDYEMNSTISHTGKHVTSDKLGCINTISFTSEISTGIKEAQDKLAPYLYPCIIEYSLMCLTIFYILWASIEQRNNEKSKTNNQRSNIYEKNPNIRQIIYNSSSANGFSSPQHHRRDVHSFTIDCSKSTTGLFLGIFVLLLTIISLITYFIYKDSKSSVAIEISEITELILICISIIVNIGIFIKFKYYEFSYKQIFEFDYNEMLIFVGLAGVYLFGLYSIIAILNHGINSTIEALSLSIQIVSIVETSLQSIIIIEGLKMFTKDKTIKKIKPARSLITLLILVDMSLWLSETFSVKKYDMNRVQLDYYDTVFWSLASTVSSPLAIFYRFHASVCLSDIWKDLYE